MKQVVAVVRPFRAQAVIDEVMQLAIDGLDVVEVRGHGRQADRLSEYLGSEFSSVYLPKVQIRILVQDDLADPTVKAVVKGARTGRIGDGKIWVLPMDAVIDAE